MEKWIKFVEAHTKLILGLGLLTVGLFLFNKYENYISDVAARQNNVAQQQLQQSIQQNQQLAAQVAAQTAQYQTLVAQLAAQNKEILAAIQQRDQAVASHQVADQTLPLADLATRWEGLIDTEPGSIQVAGSGLSASEQASRATVVHLETVAPNQQTIKDQQTLLSNKDSQINSLAGLNTTCTAQVSGLNDQLQKQQKACETQIDVIKLKSRKSKLQWFLKGAAIGGAAVAYLMVHGL